MGRGLNTEGPAIGIGIGAAKLVVVRVTDRVLAVTAVDNGFELLDAVDNLGDEFGVIRILSREFDGVGAALKVSDYGQ